jgi:hypothetical protein
LRNQNVNFNFAIQSTFNLNMWHGQKFSWTNLYLRPRWVKGCSLALAGTGGYQLFRYQRRQRKPGLGSLLAL